MGGGEQSGLMMERIIKDIYNYQGNLPRLMFVLKKNRTYWYGKNTNNGVDTIFINIMIRLHDNDLDFLTKYIVIRQGI